MAAMMMAVKSVYNALDYWGHSKINTTIYFDKLDGHCAFNAFNMVIYKSLTSHCQFQYSILKDISGYSCIWYKSDKHLHQSLGIC